jgi:predicted Zn-dependent peptidase
MKNLAYTFFAAATLFLASCAAPKVDRTHAPAAGPAPKIQIGQYTVTSLDNGMKLIVVENHKLPRVSYSLSLDIDPVLEGNRAGYTSLAGEIMGAGTTTKSKAQIDEATDFIGATLSTSADGVYGASLKKHSDKLLELMSDVLLNPSFPEAELEKAKKQTISGLQSSKTDPNSISSLISSMSKYGKDHPYGENATEETVSKVTRNDIVEYYNTFFKPNVAYLVVVGDITADEAKAQANKYFGSWKRGNVSDMKYKTPSAPASTRVVFVPVPGAVQSVIDVTYPIELRTGTSDAIAASVLNNILGGNGFQTRLMQNLREDKAYTYGAYSSISPDDVVGEFSAGASVRNEVTDSAIVQFIYEMRRLTTEPVADSTLQTVKNIMTGSFARSLERPQTIGGFAYNIEKYGLPKDYYETYLQKLNAITAADVMNIAKKLIKPDNCIITVVGNKDVLAKLEQFDGDKKVEVYNPDGTPFTEMKPVPAGVTAQTVLEAYVKAIGGVENIGKVKSFETTGKFGIGPMTLDMTTKMKDNSKLLMSVKMGANEMMKQVYDGSKGVMIQMGQKMPMEEDQLSDAKAQTDMLYEIHYANYGVTAALKGIDKLNGEEVYVMEVTKKDGSVLTEYYGVNSGLKVRSLAVETEEGETVTSETLYKEYKEANGVKFPSKITQNMGPQSFEISVNEIKINPKMDDKDFVVE